LSRAHFLASVAAMIKRGKKTLRGGEMQGGDPNWEPLLELAPEEIDDFMWMFQVELEDGAMVQAYKHWWTRRYVHLDFAGRAFVFIDSGLYEEVDADELLSAVLHRRESRAKIVRQNEWVGPERLVWARSATRHRISRERTQFVIDDAGICFEEEEGRDDYEPRLFFFGEDADGLALEVVAVELADDRLRVIHSMKLRDRFRIDYLEARGWRR
jgi:uncharacterized DUF497 family protein